MRPDSCSAMTSLFSESGFGVMHMGSQIAAIASGKMDELIIGLTNGDVVIWSVWSREGAMRVFRAHSRITSIAYSPAGAGSIVAGLEADGVLLWNRWEVKEFQTVGGVQSVAYSRDGMRLVAGLDNGIMEWAGMDRSSKFLEAGTTGVRSVVYSFDGDLAASFGDVVKVRDANGQRRSLPAGSWIRSLAYGPNRQLAGGLMTGRVVVWNFNHGGEPISQIVEAGDSPVHSVAYAPNGDLATGLFDGTIVVWRGDERLQTLRTGSPIVSIAYLSTGELAAALHNNEIRVWGYIGRDLFEYMWS